VVTGVIQPLARTLQDLIIGLADALYLRFVKTRRSPGRGACGQAACGSAVRIQQTAAGRDGAAGKDQFQQG
jgi:hypothetical protein